MGNLLPAPLRRPAWRARRRARETMLRRVRGRLRDPISFRREGLRWSVPAGDTQIGVVLYVHGQWQRREREAAISWLVRRGALPAHRRLVVNVGAHIGAVAVPFAASGWNVLALEPAPASFELLRRNVLRNGLGRRVRCERLAVAQGHGSRTLLLPADNSGAAELATFDAHEGATPWTGRARVATAPLGAVLRDHGVRPTDVALVWSDTQGCEGDVILSAPELWSAGVPLFAELWPAALDRHGGSEVLAAAVDHGFAAFVDARDLVRDGDRAVPRPVDQLASVSGELRGEAQTDILLLPARGPRG